MQFLVVNRSSRSSELLRFCELSEIVLSNRTNTVKQWILYQTCTGPDVTIIG